MLFELFGLLSLQTQGHPNQIFITLIRLLVKKILQEANWTSKKPFSRWRKCQGENPTSLRSAVQGVFSVCIRAFHQMKARLRIVDIRNIALGAPRFPSLPYVAPYCSWRARHSSPCLLLSLREHLSSLKQGITQLYCFYVNPQQISLRSRHAAPLSLQLHSLSDNKYRSVFCKSSSSPPTSPGATLVCHGENDYLKSKLQKCCCKTMFLLWCERFDAHLLSVMLK